MGLKMLAKEHKLLWEQCSLRKTVLVAVPLSIKWALPNLHNGGLYVPGFINLTPETELLILLYYVLYPMPFFKGGKSSLVLFTCFILIIVH